MSTPSAFELGASIGRNVAGGVRQAQERSALDQILEDAAASGDPSAIDNVMGQFIQRVAPERQQMAMNVLQQKKSQLMNKQTQKGFSDIAQTIESENPNSSLNRTLSAIYKSPLSIEQKEKVAKNVTTAVPYRAEQQQRLALDSVLRRYNSRIKEIDAELKSAFRKERPALEAQKKALQAERDYLLNFESLKQPKESVKEKIKFDPNNPEHLQMFEQLDEQFNGNKEKINAALNERFTL